MLRASCGTPVGYGVFSGLVPQEKITVRWKTVSEIWAEIGALWAGATMIIGWFFVKSGFLDKHGREAQVFIYQTDSMRKQQIAALSAKGMTMAAVETDESKVVPTDAAAPAPDAAPSSV